MDQHAFAYSEEYVKPTSGERAEFEIRNALEAFRNARPEHALKVRFSIACFTLCLAIHRSLGCRRVCRVINFPIKTYSVFIWIREGELELVSAQLWGKFDESGFVSPVIKIHRIAEVAVADLYWIHVLLSN
mmetsp:Transcript_39538/g.157031  ORF Transcript_39538/g.157031 Transcript_39538/m.157031 type:complete len:131 (-) Transcript_39538:1287-1679(-)